MWATAGCKHEPTDDELIKQELASGATIAPSMRKNLPPLPPEKPAAKAHKAGDAKEKAKTDKGKPESTSDSSDK